MKLRPSRPSRFANLALALLLVFVTAACGGGSGGGGGGATGPAGLAAAAQDAQVVLTWTAIPLATSYTVYKGTSSGLTTASPGPITGILLPTTTVTGLTNGTIYYFAVTAIVAGVETQLSAEATAAPVKPIFKILDTSPDASAQGIATNATVSFTFSSAANVATVSPAAVTFQSGSINTPTNTVFTLLLAAAGKSLVVTPTLPLTASTDFRVTLAGTAAGTNGIAVGSPFVLKFRTAAAPVATPLVVTSIAPTNASVNVPTSAVFELTFARDVAPADVTTANFTLTQAATPVPMSVSQPSSRVVRITPTAPLAAGLAFNVTAETGVKDTSGNALGAQFTSTATTAAAPAPTGTIAFMLYGNSAGDGLEDELVKDQNSWEASGGSSRDPKVRMYAQLDAANAKNAPNVPATPYHLKLQQDSDRTKVTSPAVRAVAAGDQTTATALSDFMIACKNDFAADRRVFVFSDHGMNYYGCNAAPGDNKIEISEMVQAFTTAQAAGVNFDVIIFDTCVMGGWEDLVAVAPFAKYILAGETTTTGMAWEKFFTQTFFPAIGTDTLVLMKDLVDKTVEDPARGEPNDYFIYDCTKLPALKTLSVAFYGQLDAALTANTPTAVSFSDAFNKALPLKIHGGAESPTELCDFTRLIENLALIGGVPGGLTTAGTAVTTAIKDAVVYARTSALWAKLVGVSCALGPVDNAVLGPVLAATSAGMANPNTQLAGKRVAETAAPANRPSETVNRSLRLAGPTPALPTELDIACTNTNGTRQYACIQQLTAPNVFTFRGVTAWNNDPTAITEWRWDGKLRRLSDGTNSGFVAGYPLDFDSTLVTVDAQLTDGVTGVVTPAIIVIDISVPRIEGVFTDAVGNVKGLGRVTLKAGDTFKLMEQTWDEALQDASEALGTTTFLVGAGGVTSLTLTSVTAPTGSYEFSVIATDPGNHDDEVSVTVTMP